MVIQDPKFQRIISEQIKKAEKELDKTQEELTKGKSRICVCDRLSNRNETILSHAVRK